MKYSEVKFQLMTKSRMFHEKFFKLFTLQCGVKIRKYCIFQSSGVIIITPLRKDSSPPLFCFSSLAVPALTALRSLEALVPRPPGGRAPGYVIDGDSSEIFVHYFEFSGFENSHC